MTEKLIRDRAPQLYGRDPGDPTYRTAGPTEMLDPLIAKFREETHELATSRDLEELVDVVEVVKALVYAMGSTEDDVEGARRAKVERAGAFEERIVWRMPGDDGSGHVLILTGPPGSGKSAVARLVAERSERSVHIEADTFFRWIVGGFVEPWLPESREQNEAVMAIVGDVAASYASAGYLTILDGMLIPGWFLEPVTARLRSADLDVATVILRPPLEVCLERAASRPVRALSDPAIIEELWDGFHGIGDLEQHVLDNGGQAAEATAKAVALASHMPRGPG